MTRTRSTIVTAFALLLFLTAAVYLRADEPTVTINGYVIDSACAFTKNLDKPISKQCAVSCAKAGSQLVILADDGTIYWPIADTTPASGQTPSCSISPLIKSPSPARSTNAAAQKPSSSPKYPPPNSLGVRFTPNDLPEGRFVP